MAVVVDDDRAVGSADHPVAERLGEQRRAEHLVGRAVRHDATGEQQHAVGVAGLAEVMGRQHDGRPRRRLVGDHLEDALLRRQVEAGDRLVEEQQVGTGGERLGDQHALALAAGQIAERPAQHRPDVHPLRRLGDRPPVVGAEPAEQAALAVATHAQHLADADRHPAVLQLVLGDERDPDIAAPFDAPGRRPQQAGEDEQQRALAAAVGSDERHRLTRRGSSASSARGRPWCRSARTRPERRSSPATSVTTAGLSIAAATLPF